MDWICTTESVCLAFDARANCLARVLLVLAVAFVAVLTLMQLPLAKLARTYRAPELAGYALLALAIMATIVAVDWALPGATKTFVNWPAFTLFGTAFTVVGVAIAVWQVAILDRRLAVYQQQTANRTFARHLNLVRLTIPRYGQGSDLTETSRKDLIGVLQELSDEIVKVSPIETQFAEAQLRSLHSLVIIETENLQNLKIDEASKNFPFKDPKGILNIGRFIMAILEDLKKQPPADPNRTVGRNGSLRSRLQAAYAAFKK